MIRTGELFYGISLRRLEYLRRIAVFILPAFFIIGIGQWALIQPNIRQYDDLCQQETLIHQEWLEKKQELEALQAHRDHIQTKAQHSEQVLEKFALNTLKFSGLLQQGSRIWGLVRLPDGKIIKVKTGDFVGEHSGKIIEIQDKFLILEETQQAEGGWKKVINTLKL